MVTKVILLYTLSKRHFPHAEIVSDNATHVSFLLQYTIKGLDLYWSCKHLMYCVCNFMYYSKLAFFGAL